MNECWWSLSAPWSGRTFFQSLADEREVASFQGGPPPPRVAEVLLSDKYQTQSSKLVQRKARCVLAPLFAKRQPHRIGDVAEDLEESIKRLGSLAFPLKRSTAAKDEGQPNQAAPRIRPAAVQDELYIAAELMSKYLSSSGALNCGGPLVQQSVRLTTSLVHALEAGDGLTTGEDNHVRGQRSRGQRREAIAQTTDGGSAESLSRREADLYSKLKATLRNDRGDEHLHTWLETSNSSFRDICSRLVSESPLTTFLKIDVERAPPPPPPPTVKAPVAQPPVIATIPFVGKVQDAPLALPLDVEVTEDIAPVCIGSGTFLSQSRRERQQQASSDRVMGGKAPEDDATLVVLKPNEELVFINGQLVKREKQAKATAKPKQKQKPPKGVSNECVDDSKGKRVHPPTAPITPTTSTRQTPLPNSRPQSRAPLAALRYDEVIALVERVRTSSGLYNALQIGLERLQI